MGLIRQAAEQGAQVVVLQELFNAPYFPNVYDHRFFDWAEPLNGTLLSGMSSLAKELGTVLVIPFFEERMTGVYHNSAAVLDADGTLLGVYRKLHIPDDPGFYEKYYFTPGDDSTGIPVFETQFGKLSVLICWDQWFPELARIAALKGAEILCYPTAISLVVDEGKEEKRIHSEAWTTIQRSHAIANSVYVAAVNRVGKEKDSSFWGHSFVSGPFGQILAQAGEKEEVLLASCDLDAIKKQRLNWPFFRDRRIDMYEDLIKRTV